MGVAVGAVGPRLNVLGAAGYRPQYIHRLLVVLDRPPLSQL
jgi:hypothetical protein